MSTTTQCHRSYRVALTALLPLALVLALLASAAPALAKAQRTPLDGVEHKTFDFTTISRMWDAGPWHFDRDITTGTGDFNFGALAGTVRWVANDKIDLSTGDGRVWGTVSYTADSGITCVGTAEGKLTAFLLTAHIVAQCSDGSLLKGTLQDLSNDGITLSSTFHGELLSP
jgi:hypothetical protein